MKAGQFVCEVVVPVFGTDGVMTLGVVVAHQAAKTTKRTTMMPKIHHPTVLVLSIRFVC